MLAISALSCDEYQQLRIHDDLRIIRERGSLYVSDASASNSGYAMAAKVVV